MNTEGASDPAADAAEEGDGSGSSQQLQVVHQQAAAADMVQQHAAVSHPLNSNPALKHPQQQQQQQKRKGAPGDPSAAQQPSKQRHKVLTMHPANLYAAGEPDFAALAAAHTPLAQHLVYPAAAAAAAGAGSSSSSSRGARPVLDFTSWEATKELTAALLKVGSGAEPNQGFLLFCALALDMSNVQSQWQAQCWHRHAAWPMPCNSPPGWAYSSARRQPQGQAVRGSGQ